MNVRFSRELQRFIQNRVGAKGHYASVSECIRDLARHDYEQEEHRHWNPLRNELQTGMNADEGAFIPLEAEAIIAEAKWRTKHHAH